MQRKIISAKNFIGLKPRMSSLANLSTFMVVLQKYDMMFNDTENSVNLIL